MVGGQPLPIPILQEGIPHTRHRYRAQENIMEEEGRCQHGLLLRPGWQFNRHFLPSLIFRIKIGLWKIDSQRLLSREWDFLKTYSLTENQFSGKTYFYTIHPCSSKRSRKTRYDDATPKNITAKARPVSCEHCMHHSMYL